MKIQTLSLKNCRSHAETVLALDRLNFIRGPTGCGKSSVQMAVEENEQRIHRACRETGPGSRGEMPGTRRPPAGRHRPYHHRLLHRVHDIPSLDAHLVHLMGFRPNVRRMPFTELGCAAGAMALGRAADYLKARPRENVLIISVELPSLTFQRKDISQANLISSVLFGDGAAAAIVRGNPAPGPKILVSETYAFADSLWAMGFDLRDSGFHILLSKDVPEMIGGKLRGLVERFLERNGRKREDIRGWILHPGGARLLGNVEAELGLCKCDTQPSWDILGSVGNVSSATILFILQEWLEKRPLQAGEYALAAAFGPCFSAELLLLQWT